MSDYKAETERLIKFAEESGSVSAATAAVATATLYLAEQQRTANLIAYSNVLEENQRDGFELTDDGRTFMDRLEVQIREGLGL